MEGKREEQLNRGVLPDYPVELTRREIFEAPDSILTWALNLIASGCYQEGDDPFVGNDVAMSAKKGGRALWGVVLCAVFVIGVAVWIGWWRRRDN